MAKTGLQMLGFGDNERQRGDYYPTPIAAVKSLIAAEAFKGSIWECACGKGNISSVLIESGFEVYSSDLVDYGYGESGIDFLNPNSLFGNAHRSFDNIITNPPFDSALDFIYTAKQYANDKIAMFLKTTFLEGINRYQMWKDKKFPFKKFYQFVRRVSFGSYEGSGMISFGWFIWERSYRGDPLIDWIL